MKKYLSLCIWGDGPGRPYDNGYVLKNMILKDSGLHLVFDNGEECFIMHPTDVDFSKNGIKIDKADRIIWKFYYYGKPKSKETLTTIQYDMIDDLHVHVLEEGAFNSERIISPKGKLAFDSCGDISPFWNRWTR